MQKIPRWLQSYFVDTDLESIRNLVEQIELTTQAELVPIIVRSSIDLNLFRLLLITIGFVMTLLIAPIIHSQLTWQSNFSTDLIYLTLFLFFSLLAIISSNSSFWVKCFFSKAQLQHLVYQRASSEFFAVQLQYSESRTAVLFMYSVLERKAMIIADPHLKQFPQTLWQNAVDKMSEAAKNKQFYFGFKVALEFVADDPS